MAAPQVETKPAEFVPAKEMAHVPMQTDLTAEVLDAALVAYEGALNREMVSGGGTGPMTPEPASVLTPEQVVLLQNRIDEVVVDEALLDYLMAIVKRTRASSKLRMGVSPRGGIGLFRAARAYALTRGRTYLVPNDIRELVVPCLAHRILPAGGTTTTLDTHEEAARILEGILDEVEAPV